MSSITQLAKESNHATRVPSDDDGRPLSVGDVMTSYYIHTPSLPVDVLLYIYVVYSNKCCTQYCNDEVSLYRFSLLLAAALRAELPLQQQQQQQQALTGDKLGKEDEGRDDSMILCSQTREEPACSAAAVALQP